MGMNVVIIGGAAGGPSAPRGEEGRFLAVVRIIEQGRDVSLRPRPPPITSAV
jgi:hypothetical protein